MRSAFPWATLVLAPLLLVAAGAAAWLALGGARSAQECQMSYMWPEYHRVAEMDKSGSRLAGRYGLYLYRDAEWDRGTGMKFQGTPVLFIPGNAGSYKQVRSLGSEAAAIFGNASRWDKVCDPLGRLDPGGGWDCNSFNPPKLDFFALDFREELSALRSATILDQAEFLNDAIRLLHELYRGQPGAPKQGITVIGHSMGGIVARTALTLQNYKIGTMGMILTLATPHSRPPLVIERGLDDLYSQLKSGARNPPGGLISVGTGDREYYFTPDLCSANSFLQPRLGFSVYTTGYTDVEVSTDHLSILWCNQLVRKLASQLTLSEYRARANRDMNGMNFWQRDSKSIPLPMPPQHLAQRMNEQWMNPEFGLDLGKGGWSVRRSLEVQERTVHRQRIPMHGYPYLVFKLVLTREICEDKPGIIPLITQKTSCGPEERVFRDLDKGNFNAAIRYWCDEDKEMKGEHFVEVGMVLDDGCAYNDLSIELDMPATLGKLIFMRYANVMSMAVGAEVWSLIRSGGGLTGSFASNLGKRLLVSLALAALTVPFSLEWTVFRGAPWQRSAIEAAVLVPLAVILGSLVELVVRTLAALVSLLPIRTSTEPPKLGNRPILLVLLSIPMLFNLPLGFSLIFPIISLLPRLSTARALSTTTTMTLLLIPALLRAVAAIPLWPKLSPTDIQISVYLSLAFHTYTFDLPGDIRGSIIARLFPLVAFCIFAIGDRKLYLVTEWTSGLMAAMASLKMVYMERGGEGPKEVKGTEKETKEESKSEEPLEPPADSSKEKQGARRRKNVSN